MEGEWTRFVSDATGWTVAVAVVLLVARALLRGDLVIGREYDRLATQLDETTERAERLAEVQRHEAAEERRRLLDRIAALEQVEQAPASRPEGEP
jgi:hypothetical protein